MNGETNGIHGLLKVVQLVIFTNWLKLHSLSIGDKERETRNVHEIST